MHLRTFEKEKWSLGHVACGRVGCLNLCLSGVPVGPNNFIDRADLDLSIWSFDLCATWAIAIFG